jgi:hypothetical protein
VCVSNPASTLKLGTNHLIDSKQFDSVYNAPMWRILWGGIQGLDRTRGCGGAIGFQGTYGVALEVEPEVKLLQDVSKA